MKTKLAFYAIVLYLLAPAFAFAQAAYNELPYVSNSEPVNTSMAIVCGNFIQRLDKGSFGYAQDILIENQDTHKKYWIVVKQIYKSAKEDAFCCYIEPGIYSIISYSYKIGKWYGFKMYTEQILSPKGELYQFTIGKSGVYYLGGWHFEKTDFHFADEWAAKKESIAKEYLNVNFDAAITAVPHE